jgi:hypothetical protein
MAWIVNNVFDYPLLDKPEQSLDLALALGLIWLVGNVGDAQLSASSGDPALILLLAMMLVAALPMSQGFKETGIIRVKEPESAIFLNRFSDHIHVGFHGVMEHKFGMKDVP